jgi:hypothetical protein
MDRLMGVPKSAEEWLQKEASPNPWDLSRREILSALLSRGADLQRCVDEAGSAGVRCIQRARLTMYINPDGLVTNASLGFPGCESSSFRDCAQEWMIEVRFRSGQGRGTWVENLPFRFALSGMPAK